MSADFYRNIINSLWPDGPIWDAKDDDGLDFLLDGMAENSQDTKDFLSNLSCLRCPGNTIILSDLEKEFGVPRRPLLNDDTRRERLANVKTDKNGDGTDAFLQKRLRESGFDIYVYRNNPTVNPKEILEGSFFTFGNQSVTFGGDGITFGSSGGEVIVNGDLFRQEPSFVNTFGNTGMTFGNPSITFGAFDGSRQAKIKYTIPDDPGYWPLVFFVGGAATYNIDGEITSIEPAIIDGNRRTELTGLIVKYKPIFSWCALIVKYT